MLEAAKTYFFNLWVELLVLAAMIGLWRWLIGRKYQAQIDELKARIDRMNQQGIRIEGDLHITRHYYGADGNSRHVGLEGKGNVVIPAEFTGGIIQGLPLSDIKIIHTKAKDRKDLK